MEHYDSDRHRRRSIRWKGYNYAAAGAYFVTFSIQNGLPLLGGIDNGIIEASLAGDMVERRWSQLPQRFPFVVLDTSVVMPDHLHGILLLHPDAEGESQRLGGIDYDVLQPGVSSGPHPTGTSADSLGRVIQAFKSLTTRDYGLGVRRDGWAPYEGRLWQRSYHDRVIRNERELAAIREYIRLDPLNWAKERDAGGEP